MEIKNDRPTYPLPFGASVKFDNEGLDGPKIVSITLMSENTEVHLNEEDCKELLNVIRGKDCYTLSCREDGAYKPHTIFQFTTAPEGRGQWCETIVSK